MAAKVEIREARLDDVAELMRNIRPADLAEIKATSRLTPDFLVEQSLRRSVAAWSAFVDGELACIIGVTSLSMVQGRGSPWMLGTPVLDQAYRILIRRTPEYIRRMLCIFPLLENYVHVENTTSVRWLKRLGFEIDAPEPIGVDCAMFSKFTMRA